MSLFSRVFSACWLIAPLILSQSAAAQAQAQAPPTEPASPQPIAVVFSNKGPSGMVDLPLGAYRPPNSNIVVSGLQKGVGILFGVAGMLVQCAANSEATKEKVGNTEDVLHVDLAQQATDITGDVFKSGKYGQAFTSAFNPDSPSLTVTPYAVISFVNKEDVVVHVFLKASYKPGRSGGASWTTRYICCTTQPVPFGGDNGLTANGGQALKDTFAHETAGAVDLMLHDVASGRARDPRSTLWVETYQPFMGKKWKIKGYKLSEDQTSIVVATMAGNIITFGGVQGIDKSVITPETAPAKASLGDQASR